MENINLKNLDDLALVELLETLKGLESSLDEIEGELGDEKSDDKRRKN